MAVLVRSGKRMIPGLSRALAAAGIPVEVAGDEIPLAAEPAVRPLLLALQVALRDCRPDADEARVLLTSSAGRPGQHGAAAAGPQPAARPIGRSWPEPACRGCPAELVAAALRHPDLLAD